MKRRTFFQISFVLVIIIGLYAWVNKDRWLMEFNQSRVEQTEQFKSAGDRYGMSNDQQACLDKALNEFDGCLGYSCTVNQGIFLKACLNQAQPSPGFCEGVPEYREKPTEDDKSWAKYYCWDNNIRGEGCRLLMKQQQYFCSGSTK